MVHVVRQNQGLKYLPKATSERDQIAATSEFFRGFHIYALALYMPREKFPRRRILWNRAV